MKRIRLIAITISAFAFMSQALYSQENFSVNVDNSTLNWKGYKPTGTHNGTITLASGNIFLKNNKIAGGNFVADMSTIKESEDNSKLENHLKSEDFFEIVVFPIAKFEITEITNKGEKIQVTGNITIKGITKQIAFPAALLVNEDSLVLTSDTFQINRADFNVKFKSKSFFNDLKDKFVNDEFDFQVTIIAKK